MSRIVAWIYGRYISDSGDFGICHTNAGPSMGFGAGMSGVDLVLLAISVAVFIYLGLAIFKAEWF